jgi:hypothetical protein
MIKIDEYFEKYPQNIIGFRVNKTTKIIDVWLNNDWEIQIPKQLAGIYVKKQKINEENNSIYYIVYSESHDFTVLYNSVSSIIEYNLDIERKQNLFKDKLTELKNLFTTLSYEELKAIQFETPYSLRNQEAHTDEHSDVTAVENIDPVDNIQSDETNEIIEEGK